MTCDEAIKLLAPYLAGKLEEKQASEVRLHLRGCRSCPRVRNYGGINVLEERPQPRERLHRKASAAR